MNADARKLLGGVDGMKMWTEPAAMTLAAPSWLFADPMHSDACQFHMSKRWATRRAPYKEFWRCMAARIKGTPLTNFSHSPSRGWVEEGWLSEEITHTLFPLLCPTTAQTLGE